jgi:hypothetical protein
VAFSKLFEEPIHPRIIGKIPADHINRAAILFCGNVSWNTAALQNRAQPFVQ